LSQVAARFLALDPFEAGCFLLTVRIDAEFLHGSEPSASVLRVGVAARVSAILVQEQPTSIISSDSKLCKPGNSGQWLVARGQRKEKPLIPSFSNREPLTTI